MTRTTIEVEKTITEEEPLDICDECGREVDEDGEYFSLTNATTIHFCSECLCQFTDGEIKPDAATRVEDWLDAEDVSTLTVRENLNSARKLLLAMPVLAILITFFTLFVLPITAKFGLLIMLCLILIVTFLSTMSIDYAMSVDG